MMDYSKSETGSDLRGANREARPEQTESLETTETAEKVGIEVKNYTQINNELNELSEISDLSLEDEEEIDGIKAKLTKALEKFLNKVKKPLGIGLLGATVLSYAADHNKYDSQKISDLQLSAKSGHAKILEKQDLPTTIQIVDSITDGAFLEIYNQFAKSKINMNESGKLSEEDVAFRERIADNVYPFQYTSPIGLYIKYEAFQNNEARFSKENIENRRAEENDLARISGTTDEDYVANFKIRVDFFRKYLGLEQNFESLKKSKYRPSQETNPNTEYFAIDDRKMVEGFIKYGNFEHFSQLKNFVKAKDKLPENNYTSNLGRYKTTIAFDEDRQEEYISYYDVWDLDQPDLEAQGINLDQFNFPFEVYSRIYESDFKDALAHQK